MTTPQILMDEALGFLRNQFDRRQTTTNNRNRVLRLLEKQGAETNKRLERIAGILGGIANILAGQGKELERHSQILEHYSQLLQTLVDRFDRFSDAVIIGRTRDTERVGDLERRMEALERRVFGGNSSVPRLNWQC